MIKEDIPRVTIAHLPTPVEPLPRLTRQLRGPELWVKRDDQTGLATGGNKARKLEFLVADALAQGADVIITCGAAQSNHARQTAAAAVKFGLHPILVLRGPAPSLRLGNLLIDQLLGAEIVWAEDSALPETMERVSQRRRAQGHHPYIVPYGGSNAVGVTGYVVAMQELLNQAEEQAQHFDHIVLPTSSGGTQAGLSVAARALGFQGRLLGISVEPTAGALRPHLAALANSASERLGLGPRFEPEDFLVNDDYLGGGYGVISDLERSAIHRLARTEGLLLDPVYTGRAFGGLLDLIKRDTFGPDETVLFWHTGGTAGLFARSEDLLL